MDSRLSLFDEALRSHHRARLLVGVDEAGRGPLAGPVVVAAVALDPLRAGALSGVRDSKALPPARREELFGAIRESSLRVSVAWAQPAEVDRLNVLKATLAAMGRAARRILAGLQTDGVLVVVDGPHPIPGLAGPQRPLIDGDAHSLAVASASIVAKVVRDRWLRRLDRRWPGYGFAAHKGYGTAAHLAALARLGPSPAHRRSFAPVAQASLRSFSFEAVSVALSRDRPSLPL